MPDDSSTPDAAGTIRADHNSKFYTRFLLMGLAALAVTGWFVYDGAYNWPLLAERYRAYQELVEAGKGSQWEDFATEKGWSTEVPQKKHDRSPETINAQFGWAALAGVVAAALLGKVLMANGRWIESDGEKITTSWGQVVPYDAVTQINKKRWAKQGIAYVQYADGDQSKRFVLDDFKFHRGPTDEILYQMEQVVGVEKITGGQPEPPPGQTVEVGHEEGELAEAAESGEREADVEPRV